MYENDLAGEIIGSAIEAHRALGPGLLESAYHQCLKHELDLRRIKYESEFPIAASYKGLVLGDVYRADLLVANEIIVELKAVEQIRPVHKAQLLTYLRLSNRRLGLLINFYVPVLKNGVHRVANNF